MQLVAGGVAVGKLMTISPSDAREWPEIQPLHAHYEALPYPLEALPALVRNAVTEVKSYVQAPTAMVAACALTNLSIAMQGFIDVARDSKLEGPTSLYFMTLGESGERKTTCDKAFRGGIDAYQIQIAEDMADEVRQYRSDKKTHEAKCSGLLSEIKKLASAGKPTDEKDAGHKQLIKNTPVKPKVPNMLLTDATPEALLFALANDWPAAAIVSDEGGAVFGGHGMSQDSAMRYLATLNSLWGGSTQRISRRTSDSFNVVNPRMTLHIQIQAAALDEFLQRKGKLAKGIGFFARFLMSVPETTQGLRMYELPPPTSPALDTFNDRIKQILNAGVPFNERGELEPSLMQLSVDAKTVWVEFHNEVETELATGGEFEDLRDTASKVADNAVRLAALFAYFETMTPTTQVSAEHMNSGVAIASWHLYESQRFFAELAITEEQSNTAKLNDWLVSYCNQNGLVQLPRREIQQLGPPPIRDKDKRNRALEKLAETGRVVLVKQGKTDAVLIHPDLLAAGES